MEEKLKGKEEKLPKKELTDEEIINRLTLKVANDVMQLYEQKLTPEKVVEKSAKKERLLKKIGEFGHFGTSAVQPLDLEKVSDEIVVETNPEKSRQIEAAVKMVENDKPEKSSDKIVEEAKLEKVK